MLPGRYLPYCAAAHVAMIGWAGRGRGASAAARRHHEKARTKSASEYAMVAPQIATTRRAPPIGRFSRRWSAPVCMNRKPIPPTAAAESSSPQVRITLRAVKGKGWPSSMVVPGSAEPQCIDVDAELSRVFVHAALLRDECVGLDIDADLSGPFERSEIEREYVVSEPLRG